MTNIVTPLFPESDGLPENILAPVQRPYEFCGHETIRVEAHQRQVTCAKCKAVLDPFDFLRDNARHLQDAWERHRQVNAKVREISERVHELSKEEKRLKARVKTLQEKTGELINVRAKRTL